MTNTNTTTTPTEEAIEAARPSITFIRPDKIAAYARHLIRNGWHAGSHDPHAGVIPAHRDLPAVVLWPKGESLTYPITTLARMFGSGNVVVVGPRKAEVMELLARLRASGEAEREDTQLDFKYDPRLRAGGSVPSWLLDQ